MTHPTWLQNAIFYQIFPERFCNGDPSNDPPHTADWTQDAPTRENFFGGDLEGVRLKLSHFKALGVNALYVTPIFAAGSNHKYDTHDYLKIDPAFGTQDTFLALLHGLHDAGLRLILDAVFNHCGDGFWAFHDVIEHGAASKYADWFLVDSYPIRFDPPSYMTCGGASFLPKLNTENPEVQAYLLQVATFWLDQGIDGWRLDVPWKAHPTLWRNLRQRIQERWPQAYLVAETWRGTSEWLGGDTVHGVMNYRLRQLILDFAALDHMDAEDLDYELHLLEADHRDSLPYHLSLLGSHDTPRLHTVCGSNLGRTIIAITLQMTCFGTPMIYYGDEIGMEGDNDPDCRRPMIWDSSRWNQPIYEATRRLIALRKTYAALRSGEFRTLRTFNGAYAYARIAGDDQVIVVLNPRGALPGYTIPLGDLGNVGPWRDILSGRTFETSGEHLCIDPLPALSSFVLIPVEA